MKTKKIALLLILILTLTKGVIAQKTLSQAAIKDFAATCTYNLKYSQQALTVALVQGLARKYGSMEKAYRIMGSAETDASSRKILFDAFHELGSGERLYMYLRDWGMNPAFAKETALYIDSRKVNDSPYFIGTKKYSNGKTWDYLVTISGNKITLKAYPNASNTFYKDKTKPTDVITGYIKDGNIITKKYQYKIEDGVLYELNNEEEWNQYREVTK